MRTTLDLPEPLFRELKARAALQGLPMKQLLQQFVEMGLRPADHSKTSTPGSALRGRSTPPTVSIGQPMALPQLSNAALFDLLDSAAE